MQCAIKPKRARPTCAANYQAPIEIGFLAPALSWFCDGPRTRFNGCKIEWLPAHMMHFLRGQRKRKVHARRYKGAADDCNGRKLASLCESSL